MAINPYLVLKANGSDIAGEPRSSNVGGTDVSAMIECLAYSAGCHLPREHGSAQGTGRRQFSPVRFTKRWDKASPLIQQALSQNQQIDAEFFFFRPNPETGEVEQFYGVVLEGGRCVGQTMEVDDVLAPGSAERPPSEEVLLTFRQCTWTCNTGGTEYIDNWSEAI